MEFEFVSASGRSKKVVILSDKQKETVQNLVCMFPQISRKIIENTVIDKENDIESCIEVLLLQQPQEEDIINEQVSDEVLWKVLQLEDAFTHVPREKILEILTKNNGDYNEAALELFTIPTNAEEDNIQLNKSKSEKIFKLNSSAEELQEQFTEDSENNESKEEVFVLNETGEQFDWFLEAKKQNEEVEKNRSEQIQKDYELALQLQYDKNSHTSVPLTPTITTNSTVPTTQSTRSRKKKKNDNEEKFFYEPPNYLEDLKLANYYSQKSEIARENKEKMLRFGLEEDSDIRVILPINFPQAIDRVHRDFEKLHYKVTKIDHILNPELARRFVYRQEMQKLTAVMCYHGTNVKNFPSIRKGGLKVPVPGSGIKVAHGSAFGLGIYLAIQPSISLSYTDGASQMLVCYAAIGNKFVTTNNGSILVITENEQVLPCFVVHYQSHTQTISAQQIKSKRPKK